jgi:hypothetical protein
MAGSNAPRCGGDSPVPAPRTCGPLGYHDAADPNVLMCRQGDTEGPLGTSEDHATPRAAAGVDAPEARLLLFDLETVARFLRSVAIAKAQQRYTRIKWEEYDEDEVLNIVYKLLPWKGKPGTAVVVQGEPIDVYGAANPDTDHLLESFLIRCAQGPEPAVKFLEAQERIRADAISFVQDAFREASEINQQVIQMTEDWVEKAAWVKFGANVIITLSPLLPAKALAVVGIAASSKTAVFAFGLIYSIIKELAKAKDANLVGVAASKTTEKVVKKGIKDGAPVAGQKVYDAVVPKSVQGTDRWAAEEAILRKQDLIAKYEQEALTKTGAKAAKLSTRIRLRASEIEDLTKATSSVRTGIGKGAVIAGKSVKFIFAGWDVYKSIVELRQDLKSSGH